MPRGGYRKHAGRKPKYPGYGDTVAIRVPKELASLVEDAIANGRLESDGIGRGDYQAVQDELNYLLLTWRNRSEKERKQELGRINRKMIEKLS